jgi:hypothetical protein
MFAETLNQMNSNIHNIQWSVGKRPSHCCGSGSGHWIQNAVYRWIQIRTWIRIRIWIQEGKIIKIFEKLPTC